MVHHLGAVRIGVKCAMLTAVPDQSAAFVSYISPISIEYFRYEGLRSQITLL